MFNVDYLICRHYMAYLQYVDKNICTLFVNDRFVKLIINDVSLHHVMIHIEAPVVERFRSLTCNHSAVHCIGSSPSRNINYYKVNVFQLSCVGGSSHTFDHSFV